MIEAARVGEIRSHRTRRRILSVVVQVLLVIWALVNLFPVYWMITFSLKSNDEILGYSYKDEVTEERIMVPPNHVGLPKTWQWSNYSDAMKTGNMGRYFLNSLVVAVTTILITIVALSYSIGIGAMTGLVSWCVCCIFDYGIELQKSDDETL